MAEPKQNIKKHASTNAGRMEFGQQIRALIRNSGTHPPMAKGRWPLVQFQEARKPEMGQGEEH